MLLSRINLACKEVKYYEAQYIEFVDIIEDIIWHISKVVLNRGLVVDSF